MIMEIIHSIPRQRYKNVSNENDVERFNIVLYKLLENNLNSHHINSKILMRLQWKNSLLHRDGSRVVAQENQNSMLDKEIISLSTGMIFRLKSSNKQVMHQDLEVPWNRASKLWFHIFEWVWFEKKTYAIVRVRDLDSNRFLKGCLWKRT